MYVNCTMARAHVPCTTARVHVLSLLKLVICFSFIIMHVSDQKEDLIRASFKSQKSKKFKTSMSKPKHMRSAFTVKLSKGRILAYLIYTLPNKGSHTPTYKSPSLSTIEPMHYPLERVEERLIGSTIFSIDDSSIRHFLCLSAYLPLPTHYYKFYLMTLLLYCSSM